MALGSELHCIGCQVLGRSATLLLAELSYDAQWNLCWADGD